MSCHTQSGVWGPAVPLAQGHRLENVQNFWHLRSVMYECLRPTNQLKDAANNTSLAPFDLGDGPAGTRAAGFNIVNAERVFNAPKLHSAMQTRTANFVMQTGSPGGINAAGPGSNVGQVVVYLFSAEILQTAWQRTTDPKYFRKLDDKAPPGRRPPTRIHRRHCPAARLFPSRVPHCPLRTGTSQGGRH